MLNTSKQAESASKHGRKFETIEIFGSKANMADVLNDMDDRGYEFLFAVQNGLLISLMFKHTN